MAFIPHTPDDIHAMLEHIGIKEIEDLFDEIPKQIPQAELDNIPLAMNEQQLLKHAEILAQKNTELKCFIGAGCYDHHIPSIIWDIATRGEFLTAYTPYQAEVSQGSLQTLYEFQSMLAELFGLDVANASLYDGATALAEAILMAKRIQKNESANQILVPQYLHPHYKKVLATILSQQNLELIELPADPHSQTTNLEALKNIAGENICAICIVQPNFLGLLEPVNELCNWAKDQKIISIACVNPMSLGILTPPGQWGELGVDIACAEGQVFGIPMANGGPMLGLIACQKQWVRQLPGRIVGMTSDKEGRRGFVLTLQAREQHIRRSKATSNICTNQGLNVIAATVYMSLMGPQGLKKVAETCYQQAHYLAQSLSKIKGVRVLEQGPYFHEFMIQFDFPCKKVIEHLANQNILAGLELEPYFPAFKNCLLVCVTEKANIEDLDNYLKLIQEISFSYLSNAETCHLGA
jgi:glycine dehydrogenase subunit 1